LTSEEYISEQAAVSSDLQRPHLLIFRLLTKLLSPLQARVCMFIRHRFMLLITFLIVL